MRLLLSWCDYVHKLGLDRHRRHSFNAAVPIGLPSSRTSFSVWIYSANFCSCAFGLVILFYATRPCLDMLVPPICSKTEIHLCRRGWDQPILVGALRYFSKLLLCSPENLSLMGAKVASPDLRDWVGHQRLRHEPAGAAIGQEMHIFERHIASLRSQALAVLATNQARAVDQSLGSSDRQVASFSIDEVQAMLAILDCVKHNLRPKEARQIAARIRAVLETPHRRQPVRVACL
ncbi:hypothetical protein SAMN05216525_15215 [Bradyrhizobium sp. Gha]|nr:hypothetical protein SAMN05216525_15215 [Bradyrhizobium sp. Gha]